MSRRDQIAALVYKLKMEGADDADIESAVQQQFGLLSRAKLRHAFDVADRINRHYADE